MPKGPRAIFSECSQPFWLDVGARLRDQHGWEIVYWIAGPELGEEKYKRFPDTVFHTNIDAIKHIPPTDLIDIVPSPVDALLLKDLAAYESSVMHMMDRFESGNSFTYSERQELYHKYLAYWGAVLDKYKPQIVLFSVMPHVGYDYVLYLLCRHKGILTAMFDHTSLKGRLLLISHIEQGALALKQIYSNLKNQELYSFELSSASKNHLSRLTASYDKAIPYYLLKFKDKLAGDQANMSPKSLIVKTFSPKHWSIALNNIVQKYTSPPPLHYLKRPGVTLSDSHWSGPAWHRYRKRKIARKKYLGKFYQSLVKDVDLSQQYVLLALHYQPEKTTSPQGGMYVNQLMLARLLAHSLPKGWKLYIKEAFGQFMPYMKGEWSRSEYFYTELATLPNTSLVNMDYDSFQLIDNAKAVATVTGTIGWEAVVRGKPALVFGYAWYRQCEGAFYTPDHESLLAALKTIQAGYKVDPHKVRLFVHALEKAGIWGSLYPKRENVEGLTAGENVTTLANALNNFYAKQLKSTADSKASIFRRQS